MSITPVSAWQNIVHTLVMERKRGRYFKDISYDKTAGHSHLRGHKLEILPIPPKGKKERKEERKKINPKPFSLAAELCHGAPRLLNEILMTQKVNINLQDAVSPPRLPFVFPFLQRRRHPSGCVCVCVRASYPHIHPFVLVPSPPPLFPSCPPTHKRLLERSCPSAWASVCLLSCPPDRLLNSSLPFRVLSSDSLCLLLCLCLYLCMNIYRCQYAFLLHVRFG